MLAKEKEIKNKASGGIQSIERAFAILNETAKHKEGISLSELSRELGIHTSTLYHLIKTLTALGCLRQTETGKRYRIGRTLYSLASTCYDEIELTDIVSPYLKQLSEQTGESTHFAIWEKEDVLILARNSGTSSFQLNERAGMLRPVYCTAIGKILLSGLPEEEVKRKTVGYSYQQHTPNTIKNQDDLILQVDKARTESIAFDDSELDADTRCMAAPIRNFQGSIIGAIGFSGPVWRMSFTDMAEYIPITKTIAKQLSEQLGYTD